MVSYFAGFRSGTTAVDPGLMVAGIANREMGKPEEVDFSSFWRAWNVINEKYAGTSTPSQEKIYGAIQGLADSLGDPYTVFFPPKESKIFASEIAGNFEGVGMEVGIKDDRLVVVAPIKDAPAERAGVKAGDFILKIDDRDSINLKTDEAVQLIRGKAGTKVKLTLGREGAKNPIEITITRARIDLPTVKTTIKEEVAGGEGGTGLRKDGVFVISLYSFSANSANLFRNALKEFIDSDSHKLVLDLRGNPGGYLEAAVDMASWFLPADATIVREEFGKGRADHEYKSKGYDIFNDSLKMVVLVDGGSASASEILAGALSEHGVAKLVGTKTFGKGSVQELVQITPETSLKVTIAKWLTPKGVSISNQGITPDYIIPVTEEDIKNKKDPQMDKAIELLSKEP
jgi:carboxyl-terminal processing protease